MLNTKNNFKALSLSTESEVLNSNKLHTCSNEKGRSMIEMLGVLAIIGVLSVGGIAGYSKAMNKFKINKTIDQIAMTVTNIRTLYAQQATYDIDGTTAWSMGVIDDAMGSSLENPFGGNYAIGVAGLDAASDSGAFYITVTGLTKEACVAIATNDWGSNYSSGLLGVATGDNTTMLAKCLRGVKAAGDGVGENYACASGSRSAALQVSKAAAGCSAGTVTLKYY